MNAGDFMMLESEMEILYCTKVKIRFQIYSKREYHCYGKMAETVKSSLQELLHGMVGVRL